MLLSQFFISLNFIHIYYNNNLMSNFLKYTLKKEDKKSTPKMIDNSKSYKSVNMYMSTNKSQTKWNLDQVVDKSCSLVNQLNDLEKTILKIFETKYKTQKILTDDLFQFMVELMTNQYTKNFALTHPNLKKKVVVNNQPMNKEKAEEDRTLIELQIIIAKILCTELKQLKNFVKLFHQKFVKLVKNTEKNKNKQQLKEFQKVMETYKIKKPNQVKYIGQEANIPSAKKKYLQDKESKLKKIKDKSKQSLGTLGSKEATNSNGSHNNHSSNKGSIEDGGSLFKLLKKEKKQIKPQQIKQEKYDYSAIMSGSKMNIKTRSTTNTEEIKQPPPASHQKTQKIKNDGFVFFKPKKPTGPSKKS